MRAKKKVKPKFKNMDRESGPSKELLPLDNSDDDDSEEEADEMAQYSNILKQYRLQQFKEGIASDLEDGDDDDDDQDNEFGNVQLEKKHFASEKWGLRKDTFYGAEGEDELVIGAPGAREEQVEAEEEAAEMEEVEIDRLRRLLYGGKTISRTVVASNGVLGATLEHEIAADRCGGDVGAIDNASDSDESMGAETDERLTVGGLRPYCPPSKDLPLESHLNKHYPELVRIRAKLQELTAQRASWWGRNEKHLEPLARFDKYYTIMLASFLSMCERGIDMRRHAILPTLRRLENLRNEIKRSDLQSTAKLVIKNHSTVVLKPPTDVTDVNDTNDENDMSDDDLQGARPASYDILKNREVGRPAGSKRVRKRDRNPRVKARYKFKKAVKRRKSQVPTIRNQTKPYGGETSGIRSGMVRARKFKV